MLGVGDADSEHHVGRGRLLLSHILSTCAVQDSVPVLFYIVPFYDNAIDCVNEPRLEVFIPQLYNVLIPSLLFEILQLPILLSIKYLLLLKFRRFNA